MIGPPTQSQAIVATERMNTSKEREGLLSPSEQTESIHGRRARKQLLLLCITQIGAGGHISIEKEKEEEEESKLPSRPTLNPHDNFRYPVPSLVL